MPKSGKEEMLDAETGKLVIRLSGLSMEKGQTLMRGKATQVGQSGMQGPIRMAVPQETNETRVPKQIIQV